MKIKLPISFFGILLVFYSYGQDVALNTVGGHIDSDETSYKTLLPSTTPSLKDVPATSDNVYIDFFGTGDIQKSLSQGDEIKANTGVGVVYERYRGTSKWIQSFELEAAINVASTSDTINAKFDQSNSVFLNKRDFGLYVLNPVSTKQSFMLNSNLYFGYPEECNKCNVIRWITKNLVSGINTRFIASNNVWVHKDSFANLGSLLFRGGLFYEIVPDNYRIGKQDSNDEGRSLYSIILGVNFSKRWVIGDIGDDNRDKLRETILGTTQMKFAGVEFNCGIRLKNLRAEFQMPILKNDGAHILGLTQGQFLFSIKFVGGFGLKLNTNKETTSD